MKKNSSFRVGTATVVALLVGLSGCAKTVEKAASESTGANPGTAEAASQVIERTSDEVCKAQAKSDKPLSEMKIGFSQSENEQNPFRAVETKSVREAVEQHAKEFIYTNANSDQAKQLSDIQSMISQDVDALIVAPIGATGLQSAFAAAKEAGIPVVTIDRKTEGTPCEDYLSFLGSDFEEQGNRAGESMIEALGGEGEVAEIQGAPGSDVAVLRTDGFAAALGRQDKVKVVAQQTGNWATSEAQTVTEQLLSSHPEVKGIYTHSDTMALGALSAIRNAGKEPGKDVFVVSIDGTKDAVSRIPSGEVYSVVETNPRFFPAALEMFDKWFKAEDVAQEVIMKDSLYTADNAQEALDTGKAY